MIYKMITLVNADEYLGVYVDDYCAYYGEHDDLHTILSNLAEVLGANFMQREAMHYVDENGELPYNLSDVVFDS